jgi:glycosyltransferase involved in cell wall biosynthesis
MRLLHVIHGLSPADGGPPENLRQLALAFAEVGVEIEVLSQDRPNAPYLARYPFPIHTIGSSRTAYGYNRKLLAWLHKHVSRYDGVVVEGVWQYNGVAVRAALLGRVPYLVFTHGMLDPWFQKTYPFKHIKKYIYWFAAQHKVLRDAFRVVFTTQAEEELATQSFWPHVWRSVVVPLGTNRPPGNAAQQVELFLSACPAVRGRRFLLFLGRIHEKKGCDLLIEAFARVAAQDKDLDIVMAGPDQVGLRARLEKMAEERGVGARVHWPGMLEGDAKWGAFHAAEAFILPSHQENFGIAIAEAIACAKPVLISNKINIWHYVTEDEVGFVEEDTVEGTERLLRSWLALTPEEREAMVTRTDASFEKRFSMRNCAIALRNIFEEARAESSAAPADNTPMEVEQLRHNDTAPDGGIDAESDARAEEIKRAR